MVSHHQASNILLIPDQDSHLLKLPLELRNRICEYALVSEASLVAETYAPRRPGLLQICRQPRIEFRLKYFELTRFHIIVTVNNTDEIRRWATAITDEELRSIPSLTFQLRTKYGRLAGAMADRQSHAIVAFHEIVGRLKQRCSRGNITDVRYRAFAPYFFEGHVWV